MNRENHKVRCETKRNEPVANCDWFRYLKHNQQYPPMPSHCFAFAHDRFRKYFMFRLTDSKVDLVVSQNATPFKQHLGDSLPHDRFLIIDDNQLYHFGASLKDLGKKWFGFSKMNNMTEDVLKRLGGRGHA